ncbi:MAG: hypothetical protein JO322_15025 [Candidatus Eremiobacteraeota bacterium]|nr:hypothetical protein [Candidatus Eremiobacteraeota bacterium]
MLALDNDALRAAVSRVRPDPARRARYFLYDILRRNFRALAAVESLRPPLRFAYSVKTNPDGELLECANDAGLYAEVIGPQELDLAHRLGFGSRTVYNGPHPAWRAGDVPGVIFSDSPESFAENARRVEGALVGIRVRPPGVASRFGIAESQLDDIVTAIRSSGRRTTGVSLHVRPQDFGNRSWRQIVASGIDFAREIEKRTGAKVTAFDVGGGKTPVEFDQSLAAGDFAWLLRETLAALAYAHAIFAEPGQAVVTPGAFFVAPVLEIRRYDGAADVVVDAGYPDLPQIHTFPHRVLALAGNDVALLERGNDRILGCTCLEYDVIRDDVRLPAHLDALEAIVIADAGAYDHSMSFDFARGGNRPVDERIGVPGG